MLSDFLVSFPKCFWYKEADNQGLSEADQTVEDEETGGADRGDHWVGGLHSHEDHEELVADQDHRHQQLDVSKEPFSCKMRSFNQNQSKL